MNAQLGAMTKQLPDENEWDFAAIRADDADCAKVLEMAPDPQVLLDAFEARFDSALRSGSVRIGRECAEKRPQDFRAVMQFYVGTSLFNWFFNGRTGYRAHYWASKAQGLAFNRLIVEIVRSHPLISEAVVFSGRDLNANFEDCGEAQITGQFLKSSLDPDLAKVWFCGRRIESTGGTVQIMPSFTRPKIALENGAAWTTIYAENDGAAWIDIKGAFLGSEGRYQPKSPMKRAEKLNEDGTA